jgi:hypothetical protein
MGEDEVVAVFARYATVVPFSSQVPPGNVLDVPITCLRSGAYMEVSWCGYASQKASTDSRPPGPCAVEGPFFNVVQYRSPLPQFWPSNSH